MRPVVLFSVLCFAAVASAASAANAGVSVGADVNVGVAFSPIRFGTGYGARVGYDLEVGPIGLTPEIGASCYGLDDEDRAARLLAGGRLHLRGLIQPAAYWHYGYTWIVGQSRGGPTVDMGGALDLSLAIFRVGAHAGIVSVQSTTHEGPYAIVQPIEWFELGLHGGLSF
ncbi:hypothetical protein [Polyangium aurulentum]|uniref:hypothetical protein n=1 Tax=Polyangium aurulentum TaxID=2567896 RepID=UPI0010AEAF2B|nr:hypothetical protein [Polyangium aurulentum]UQA58096.1 hypothetical protein E8A73_043680 [Polyangium aurulentum]